MVFRDSVGLRMCYIGCGNFAHLLQTVMYKLPALNDLPSVLSQPISKFVNQYHQSSSAIHSSKLHGWEAASILNVVQRQFLKPYEWLVSPCYRCDEGLYLLLTLRMEVYSVYPPL